MTAVRAEQGIAARVPDAAAAAIALAAFVLAWKVLVIVTGYPPFILPAPEVVLARFVTAWTDGTIPPHALRTLYEVALGFTVGAGSALVVGYALARLPLAGVQSNRSVAE